MPKALHRALKRSARKKFHSTTSKRARAYIYGGLRRIAGWKPRRRR